jgi:uncharacterized protein YcbK (DUF882 family)
MTIASQTRRTFLGKLSGGFAALTMSMFYSLPASARKTIGHSVSFKNIHTGEVYKGIYRVGGYYIPEEFKKINHVLRDHRENESRAMDPKLIDIIADIQKNCGCLDPVGVLSGYRTEKTNKMLRRSTSGVAKKSYHIKGKAADIRLEGYKTKYLCNQAMKLRRGGVGYYPRSGFVHVDTGKVRHWSS